MDMTQLSPHFSLREMTRSDTALRLGIDNIPTAEHLSNLVLVCVNILEPVRKVFGAVRINSGYRSLALNMSVNPMTSTIDKLSKHCLGQAVDFEVDGTSNAVLAQWCVDNLPVWDKIILEFYTPGQPNSGWVHGQYVVGQQRKETYTAVKVNGKTTYLVGLQP
jgi:hypothetical protein